MRQNTYISSSSVNIITKGGTCILPFYKMPIDWDIEKDIFPKIEAGLRNSDCNKRPTAIFITHKIARLPRVVFILSAGIFRSPLLRIVLSQLQSVALGNIPTNLAFMKSYDL